MRAVSRCVVLGCVFIAGGTLAGCVADENFATFNAVAAVPTPEIIEPAPLPSQMPWQLSPASTNSVAQGEKTIVVADPRFGKIKGTTIAVANLDKPIIAFAPRSYVVDACKQMIEPQAKSIGAYSVQAAAAGPVKRRDDGSKIQQVFFRIIYDLPGYLEVRQSALLCRVDPRGKVVDLHPV